MHEYYTPKSIQFQAILGKITIFVNYADFYVNIIMLTASTDSPPRFTISYYFAICCVSVSSSTLNIDFARIPAHIIVWVNFVYPYDQFVHFTKPCIFGAFLPPCSLRPGPALPICQPLPESPVRQPPSRCIVRRKTALCSKAA